jgi:hypothetical protein
MSFSHCFKFHFYLAQRIFSHQANLCMYTHFYYRRAKSESSIMAPRKESKVIAENSWQGSYTISYTSPRSIDSVGTWSYASEVLQSELVNYSDDSNDNENNDLATKYKIVIQAEMHKIESRPRILPYYDMIYWALNHVDI